MKLTPSASPALEKRSELYPASWHDRVPKRIRMAKTVRSDVPVFLKGHSSFPDITAHNGIEYDCWVNSHGAVVAILDDEMLGVKPYEFEVIEWHDEIVAGMSVELNESVPVGEIRFVKDGELVGVIYNIGTEERKA